MEHALKILFSIALLMGAIFWETSFAKAENHADTVLGCTARPCIVNKNYGGEIHKFKSAGNKIARNKEQLVINGDCASACVIAAEIAKPRACITPKARFGFHKAFIFVETEANGEKVLTKTNLHDMPVSPKLAKWVNDRGGFPVDPLLWMSYAEAQKFWPSCMIENVPLPRRRPHVVSNTILAHGLY